MKRGQYYFLVFLVMIVFVLIVSSQVVLAEEAGQIKKTYSWLQSRTVDKWDGLNIEQHVFSLLATEDRLTLKKVNASLASLFKKSYDDGTCWGANSVTSETGCDARHSTMAKIAIDSVAQEYNFNSNKVSDWLSARTGVFLSSDADWYLQVIQQPEIAVICDIEYESGIYGFTIDALGKIHAVDQKNRFGSCFNADKEYWLSLGEENDCPKKTFNVTCNESVSLNFLFKNQGTWYVTSKLVSAQALETTSINLTSYCIEDNTGNCDYESTLWTAYAFSIKNPKISMTFLPYLLMQKDNNKKYLPSSFLYKITQVDNFADEVSNLQENDGLISADTRNNRYYDTAIAGITESVTSINETNMIKLKNKLLGDEKRESTYYYWCSGQGCDSIKETGMLLYAFWKGYQWIPECELNGLNCVTNCSASGGVNVEFGCFKGECCNLSSPSNPDECATRNGNCKLNCFNNETQTNYGCSSGVCCKLISLSSCVSEIHGQLCYANQKCINAQGTLIPMITSVEGPNCCKGTCTTPQGSCTSLNGVICNPSEGKSCQGGFISAPESYCCPSDKCTQIPLTCQQQGGQKCSTGKLCNGGTFISAADTNGMQNCCISGGTCIKETCEASSCLEDESCNGKSYETSDALKCCEGTCLKKCQDLGTPCSAETTCKGNIEKSSDFLNCCVGTCQKKGKFPTIVVIIIVGVIILGLLVFFAIKKRKKSGSNEDIGEENFPDYGFPSQDSNEMLKTDALRVPKAPR